MKKILYLSLFLVLFSTVIFADEAPPKPTPKPSSKKSIETNLSIRIDKNAQEAKLIIPKSQIKQLRAELAELDDDSDTTAANSFTKTQTIVSGLFMSLAIVFGGVWLVRSRKINTKTGKTLAAGAVLFCVGSLATIAFGNAGPPPELRQISGKLFDKKVFSGWVSAFGKIKLEVSDQAQYLQLIVPDVPDEKKPGEE